MDSGKNDISKPAVARYRPLHGFLKLMVEADSSRSYVSRIRAGTILLMTLAAFGAAGYFVPVLLLRYF